MIEYQRPPLTLLKPPAPVKRTSGESPEERGRLLVETLASFNISARLLNISVGPVITRYVLQPAQGVRVKQIVEDASPGRMIYDPRNPAANEEGYVMMPNVSAVDEMVNMISSSRSYQTNAEVMNTAKQLLLRTLTLGQ